MKRRKWWLLVGIAALICVTMGMFACSGSSNGHSLTLHEATNATCIEEGHDAYYSCSHCDKLFADAKGEQEVARKDVFHAALGHSITDESYVTGKPNSCTAAGVLAHYGCERCGKAFADKAGNVLIENTVLPAAHAVGKYYTRVAPTIAAEGHTEYWTCANCGKYFSDLACTHEITEAQTVLVRIPEHSVAITVKEYDERGNATDISVSTAKISSDVASDAQYALDIDKNGAATNDKSNGGKYAAGTYKIVADGYYVSEFTIAESDTQKEVSLYKLDRTLYNPENESYVWGFIDGEQNKSFAFDKQYADGKWSTVGMLELANSEGDQNYIYEFTLGLSSLPTSDWNNRFMFAFKDSDGLSSVSAGTNIVGIGMAFGNGNLQLYNLQQNWADMTDTPKQYGAANSSATDRALTAAFYRAAESGSLKMRIVRYKNTATLYVNAQNSWIAMRSVTLSSSVVNNGLIVAAMGSCNASVSDISVGKFVDIKTTDTEAVLAHFEMDNNVFGLNGLQTTQAEIRKPFVTLNTFAAQVESIATLSENLSGKLIGTNIEYDVTVNKDDSSVSGTENGLKFVAGTYTFTADGWFPAQIEITEQTTSVNMKLFKKLYTIHDGANKPQSAVERVDEESGKHSIVTNTGWDDLKDIVNMAYWEIADSNGSGNYRLEFTVNVAQRTGGLTAYQNRIYYMGFGYSERTRFANSDSETILGIRTQYNNVGNIFTAAQKSDGTGLGTFTLAPDVNTIRLCVIRLDNKMFLYESTSSGLNKLAETQFLTNSKGFTVATNNNQDITFSDIVQSLNYNYVAASEVTDDNGVTTITTAHYKDENDNYYDVNGNPVKREDVVTTIKNATPTSFVVSELDSAVDAKLSVGKVVIDVAIDIDGNVTRKDNKTWYPNGSGILMISGYKAVNVTIADNAAVTVSGALEKFEAPSVNGSGSANITVGDNGQYTLKTPWNDDGNVTISDMGVLQLLSGKTEGNYSVEFTLNGGRGNGTTRIYFAAADFEQVQKFDITKSDKVVGISIRTTGNGNGNMYYGDLHERYRDDANLQQNTTRCFKLERKGNVLSLYYQLDDNTWTLLHSVTLDGDMTNNGLVVFGTAGDGSSDTLVFSDIVITPIAG